MRARSCSPGATPASSGSATGRSWPSPCPATWSCGSARSGSIRRKAGTIFLRESTIRRGSVSASSSPTPGALLVLIALILGGIGVRRLGSGGGAGLLKAAMVIAWIVLAAALVAVWAMAGKPELARSRCRPLLRPKAGSAGREAKRAPRARSRKGGGLVGGTVGSTHARTTTGSTPGSPRSAVRYRAHRSPCGVPCSAHHPTFVGSLQVPSCAQDRNPLPRIPVAPLQARGHSAARYFSFSHSVTWTRYSSHSRRFSSM